MMAVTGSSGNGPLKDTWRSAVGPWRVSHGLPPRPPRPPVGRPEGPRPLPPPPPSPRPLPALPRGGAARDAWAACTKLTGWLRAGLAVAAAAVACPPAMAAPCLPACMFRQGTVERYDPDSNQTVQGSGVMVSTWRKAGQQGRWHLPARPHALQRIPSAYRRALCTVLSRVLIIGEGSDTAVSGPQRRLPAELPPFRNGPIDPECSKRGGATCWEKECPAPPC